MPSSEDLERIKRIVIATTRNFQETGEIRSFLLAKGFSDIKVKSFGSREVALEFPDNERNCKDKHLKFLV